MPKRQLWRHQSFCEEALRSVKIREQRIKHARALRHTFLNLAPLVLRKDKG